MENEELIKQYITALDASLDDLEPAIKELSAKSFEDRINETSDEHERIKIANGYAYILTSLSFVDTAAAKRFIEAALNNGTGNSTVITGTPEPAISSASFQGKHTKFQQSDNDSDEKNNKDNNDKIRNKQNKKIGNNDKVKKPKKDKKKSTK
ncbi:Exosome complex protein LRP1 [Wickerhamomyces ciferrii]|uniref:Exosome complex protein LRP1 n=1 Tax=Wickerhamomyces ciferrii (strain ATCC 14091 / BCRC 22168 / CBS 111 / JCM 3599 / NBRC 0793 / NRRL Y-1031 F-60-10) TaxID=1206466 RepID=K0KPF4_WICCF|nr:Exosome complex protein LRP1 [Wickerhamomyces ciferrii]CCH44062.1 Exosome complex protein LRP1 [Wickerhamomyces ciferrii]